MRFQLAFCVETVTNTSYFSGLYFYIDAIELLWQAIKRVITIYNSIITPSAVLMLPFVKLPL